MENMKSMPIVRASSNLSPNARSRPARHGGQVQAAPNTFQEKLSAARSQRDAAHMSPASLAGGVRLPSARPNMAMHHDFNERLLHLHAYRLQLLASNMANVATPGYKAVDIEHALRSGQAVDSKRIPLKYHAPAQDSVDGNTVDMDVEQAKFADSVLRYQYAIDRVKGHYRMMDELLKSTPY